MGGAEQGLESRKDPPGPHVVSGVCAAHERFFGSYLDELRSRLEDPDFSLTHDALMVCQRFRLVERYPEPIPPPNA